MKLGFLHRLCEHVENRANKDAPLVLPLVAKGKDLAVFEGKEGETFLRLTYRREGKALTVVLEKGKEPVQTYRFKRAR